MIPRQTLTITRYVAGTRVNGSWVEGASSTFTAKYSIQPLKGKEMEMLPEQRRSSQSYKLYGDTELKTVNTVAGTNADRISIYGEQYEVFHVEPWQNGLINHYKVFVLKV